MEIVNFLAQLWGFCLIIVCLSFLIKPRHIKNILAVAENETVLLFLGLLNVMLGVGSLLAYNALDHTWREIITILGWLMVIKGTLYLCMPDMVVKYLDKFKKEYVKWFPTILVVGVLFGCLLVYLGSSL